jgi:hypothetical protein
VHAQFPDSKSVEKIAQAIVRTNDVLSFLMQFCPTDASEKELMARFAKIGVGAGKAIDLGKLPPELRKAIEEGMADAWAELAGLKKRVDAGEVTAGDIFGRRTYLKK